jgi:hypothetical protein
MSQGSGTEMRYLRPCLAVHEVMIPMRLVLISVLLLLTLAACYSPDRVITAAPVATIPRARPAARARGRRGATARRLYSPPRQPAG